VLRETRSRFLTGRTERKARAKARTTAKANTGVLRFAQDDDEKLATTRTTATATANATTTTTTTAKNSESG
jgi:hypothetical protein